MFHLLRFQRHKHKSHARHRLVRFVFFSSGLVFVIVAVIAVVVKLPAIRTDGKAEVGYTEMGKSQKRKS